MLWKQHYNSICASHLLLQIHSLLPKPLSVFYITENLDVYCFQAPSSHLSLKFPSISSHLFLQCLAYIHQACSYLNTTFIKLPKSLERKDGVLKNLKISHQHLRVTFTNELLDDLKNICLESRTQAFTDAASCDFSEKKWKSKT